jgi:hypothetical protein
VQVVKSDATGGDVTGAALASLASLLRRGLLDPPPAACSASAAARSGATEALSEVVEAVATCRFERTDAPRDDVVAAQAVAVLARCVGGPGGRWLPDERVWDAAQDCFTHRNAVSLTAPAPQYKKRSISICCAAFGFSCFSKIILPP